mgnify:CR=1 FL=1
MCIRNRGTTRRFRSVCTYTLLFRKSPPRTHTYQHHKHRYSCLESPIYAANSRKRLKPSHRVFDWTMTLNRDSTIEPSWYVVCFFFFRNDQHTHTHTHRYYTSTLPSGGMKGLLGNEKVKIPEKTNLVAWTVSNCETASNREMTAKQLSNSLKKINQRLDIFGAKDCMSSECVPGERKSCPDKHISFPSCPNDSRVNPDKKCVERVLGSYYFYLSWENSICEDYVTEKFYDALRRSIVPVVLEGGWYDRLVPKGYDVFIRASDYDNTDELASRLVEISRNRTLYESYFKWREIPLHELPSGFLKHVVNAENPWCDLCRKLHEDDDDADRVNINVEEWYGVENRCKQGQNNCCWF